MYYELPSKIILLYKVCYLEQLSGDISQQVFSCCCCYFLLKFLSPHPWKVVLLHINSNLTFIFNQYLSILFHHLLAS